MHKMKDTSKQFGGDMASIQENIASNEKELKRLKDMKYQYQVNSVTLEVPLLDKAESLLKQSIGKVS